MVSTRNHPAELPPPDLSPSKPATTTSSSSPRKGRKSTSPPTTTGAKPLRHGGAVRWAHLTTPATLLWLCVSLPLVAWDTSYVFLRPHSLPGGRWHDPVWTLYGIYARVDHVYGWPAWEEGNGWTAAQSLMNCLETALYVTYLAVVWTHGREAGEKEEQELQKRRTWWEQTWVGRTNVVEGASGARASLVGFAAAIMTASKTLLYCAYHSRDGCRDMWVDDGLT